MYQLIQSAVPTRSGRRSRFLAKARRQYCEARVARARLYVLVSALATVTLLAAVPAPDVLRVLAQLQTHPVLETLWPTSIAGALGIVMSTIAFAGVVTHAIKKPGEVAAKAVEDRIEVKIDKLTEALRVMGVDGERTTKFLSDALAAERAAHQVRVDDMHRGFAERDARLREMDINWTQSREDRRHLAQSFTEFKGSISEWRKEETARFDKMFEVLLEALRPPRKEP